MFRWFRKWKFWTPIILSSESSGWIVLIYWLLLHTTYEVHFLYQRQRNNVTSVVTYNSILRPLFIINCWPVCSVMYIKCKYLSVFFLNFIELPQCFYGQDLWLLCFSNVHVPAFQHNKLTVSATFFFNFRQIKFKNYNIVQIANCMKFSSKHNNYNCCHNNDYSVRSSRSWFDPFILCISFIIAACTVCPKTYDTTCQGFGIPNLISWCPTAEEVGVTYVVGLLSIIPLLPSDTCS